MNRLRCAIKKSIPDIKEGAGIFLKVLFIAASLFWGIGFMVYFCNKYNPSLSNALLLFSIEGLYTFIAISMLIIIFNYIDCKGE